MWEERDDKLVAEMVGITIEGILFKIGLPAYEKVVSMLQGRYATFADCYYHPQLLNTVLKEVFGEGHRAIADQIKNDLQYLNERQKISQFIQVIN